MEKPTSEKTNNEAARERDFWLVFRRALLMLVHAIESYKLPGDPVPKHDRGRRG